MAIRYILMTLFKNYERERELQYIYTCLYIIHVHHLYKMNVMAGVSDYLTELFRIDFPSDNVKNKSLDLMGNLPSSLQYVWLL